MCWEYGIFLELTIIIKAMLLNYLFPKLVAHPVAGLPDLDMQHFTHISLYTLYLFFYYLFIKLILIISYHYIIVSYFLFNFPPFLC
jgi:hypothetical protein